MRAIGLMSGTSMDGVDAAIVETDGEVITSLGPTLARSYEEAERAVLRAALEVGPTLANRTARPGVVAEAERIATTAHAEAVEDLMVRAGLGAADIDVVGFHGQTIFHAPARRLTIQIGDGPALARRLGLTVVHDFRAADVAAGGEGAPLVPIFHQALVARAQLDLPVAVLNLGGVGNVTFVGAAELLAFDTGPGNALIDDFMRARCGLGFDRDGMLALSGKADATVLAQLLDHPYFDRPPPKSLDRNAFDGSPVAALSEADGAATLVAFTAKSAARAVAHLPSAPRAWIVAGGGARNPAILGALVAALAARGAPAEVITADALGWSADFMEAQAFAYLAVRSLRGLPLTFPRTTGVAAPLTGGVVAQP